MQLYQDATPELWSGKYLSQEILSQVIIHKKWKGEKHNQNIYSLVILHFFLTPKIST